MSILRDYLRQHRVLPRKKVQPGQHPEELAAFLRMVREEKVGSYLEVGCCFGGMFDAVMREMPIGSRGVAVDLPEAAWGRNKSAVRLRGVVRNLRADGFDTHLFLGSSQEPSIVEQVRALGPFDLAFIDGDHRYEGVRADWLNYGPMARLVAFHDIVGDGVIGSRGGHPVEVPRLWRELKAEHSDAREFVGNDSKMGIGVVRR